MRKTITKDKLESRKRDIIEAVRSTEFESQHKLKDDARTRAITQDRIKELLHYDPETGHFTWLQRRAYIPAGSKAGTIANGYVQIAIDGCLTYAHRLAYIYMTGEQPITVDHINMVRDDNRWCNLRHATQQQNKWNSKAYGHREHKGVSERICKDGTARYHASIRLSGKMHFIGSFDTADEASAAYNEIAKEFHGEFFRAA